MLILKADLKRIHHMSPELLIGVPYCSLSGKPSWVRFVVLRVSARRVVQRALRCDA